jgi:hypothetical protein
MFAVKDIEDVLARLRAHGAELLGDVAQYEDSYRLCYLRGPEGIIVGLAEQIRERSVAAELAHPYGKCCSGPSELGGLPIRRTTAPNIPLWTIRTGHADMPTDEQIGVLSVLSRLPRAAAVGTRTLRRRARSPAPADPLVASALMR